MIKSVKAIFFISILISLLLLSCETKKERDIYSYSESSEDSEQISLSTIKTTFPFYFQPPEGYRYGDNYTEMNFDEIYRFYKDSSTLTVGGKHYETGIILKEPDEEEKKKRKRKKEEEEEPVVYSSSLIFAHYNQQIKAAGGIEVDLSEKSVYPFNHQDAASIKRYVIRTDKGIIWIDIIALSTLEQVNYSVIFEGKIKEPVNIIEAERLNYALNKYGRVVVYVNFADGKASLQPNGIKAIDEIAKLMRINKELKLSIEAHTDDAGSTEYCKKLSSERLKTIADYLKELKVNPARFKTIAYGSDRFVADNTTTDNKAKNRRIELVKINVDETRIRKEIEESGKAVLQISFDSGKATLKDEGLDVVSEIAKLMTSDAGLRLSIEGHTDNIGNATSNKRLSLERANTIINELIEFGIDSRRLRAVGHGQERPLVSNDNDQNREMNRRVEIVKINR